MFGDHYPQAGSFASITIRTLFATEPGQFGTTAEARVLSKSGYLDECDAGRHAPGYAAVAAVGKAQGIVFTRAERAFGNVCRRDAGPQGLRAVGAAQVEVI